MGEITYIHTIGMFITLSFIMIIGVKSGSKINNASDFTTGGKNAGTGLISGALISTLIGGSSTIGTAQLAFEYGVSAWWFTLGSGIGCLLYALIFVKPLRNSNVETIKEVITREYGAFCGTVTSVLSLFSIIINIVAQITSANALLTASFGISLEFSTLLTVVIIISYVTFGGVKATGVLGNVKLVLIYMAIIFGVYKIWNLSDGFLLIHSALPKEIYFNMFSRGFGVDIGSLIAVVLGVICGQTYLQIILSGKTNKHAFNATMISSLLLPPVGLGSVWIGMYMKTKYPFIESSQAFPLFVINNMPQLLGGVILATLLLALVGTASGMALGFGTIMTKDIFNKYINIKSNIFNELSLNRIFIVISIISSSLISSSNYQSSILRWGYLATGFRGVALLYPMLGSLFFKGLIDPRYVIASSVLGIASYLACELLLNLSFDSIFIGLSIGFIIFVLGALKKQKA